MYFQKVKQTDVHLREQGELQRKELDTWRKNTENVTSSMGRKDMAIEALQSRVKELEDEVIVQRVIIVILQIPFRWNLFRPYHI